LLIGMHEVQQNFSSVWLAVLIAIPVVLVGRATAIYPCCLLFAKSRLRISLAHQHILFWGGNAWIGGAGPGIGATRRVAEPGDDHHGELCRGCVFALRSGALHASGLAQNG